MASVNMQHLRRSSEAAQREQSYASQTIPYTFAVQ